MLVVNKLGWFLLLFVMLFSGFSFAEDGFGNEDDDAPQAEAASKSGPPITSLPFAELANGADETQEYHIGPRDLIQIEVFQVPELGDTSRVGFNGDITLPLLGTVNILDMTVTEAQAHIEKLLSKDYMQNPQVTIDIQEYESQKITLEGWINAPGIYSLTGKTTFLQAIAIGKGMDKLANFDEIAVFRKKPDGSGTMGYIVNYEKIRSGVWPDPVVKNGDVIVVSKDGGKALWEATASTLTSFAGWAVFF